VNGGDSARDRILGRVRAATAQRAAVALPPVLDAAPMAEDPLTRFARQFAAAGGEVILHADRRAAVAWCAGFSRAFQTAAVSVTLDADLAPALPRAGPEVADLGVSVALAASAETGSLLLDSRDGRRLQLLAPVHLVWLPAAAVYATLGDALAAVRGRHGAAIGLHSGPSKSADIGGVLVRGVHGPGRVIASIVGSG
jgi:L-lactate dehydrogenase complex protein LldG